MEMNDSVIEQQRLDQARLEANGMYSSQFEKDACGMGFVCLLYTSPSPRDSTSSRMPSSA